MRLLLVEWTDASVSSDCWTPRDDYELTHTVPCVSCGILIRETEKDIVLCQSLNPACKLLEVTIPKGCIKRIRYLKIEIAP